MFKRNIGTVEITSHRDTTGLGLSKITSEEFEKIKKFSNIFTKNSNLDHKKSTHYDELFSFFYGRIDNSERLEKLENMLSILSSNHIYFPLKGATLSDDKPDSVIGIPYDHIPFRPNLTKLISSFPFKSELGEELSFSFEEINTAMKQYKALQEYITEIIDDEKDLRRLLRENINNDEEITSIKAKIIDNYVSYATDEKTREDQTKKNYADQLKIRANLIKQRLKRIEVLEQIVELGEKISPNSISNRINEIFDNEKLPKINLDTDKEMFNSGTTVEYKLIYEPIFKFPSSTPKRFQKKYALLLIPLVFLAGYLLFKGYENKEKSNYVFSDKGTIPQQIKRIKDQRIRQNLTAVLQEIKSENEEYAGLKKEFGKKISKIDNQYTVDPKFMYESDLNPGQKFNTSEYGKVEYLSADWKKGIIRFKTEKGDKTFQLKKSNDQYSYIAFKKGQPKENDHYHWIEIKNDNSASIVNPDHLNGQLNFIEEVKDILKEYFGLFFIISGKNRPVTLNISIPINIEEVLETPNYPLIIQAFPIGELKTGQKPVEFGLNIHEDMIKIYTPKPLEKPTK